MNTLVYAVVVCVTLVHFCDEIIGISVRANNNSCAGRCLQNYNSQDPCQCNNLCQQYGNCCDDFITLCTDPTSCKFRCDSFNSTYDCNCNSACEDFGDCCDDYLAECTEPTSPPDVEQYLCKGECNVMRGRCSCMPGCDDGQVTCCADYAQSCQGKKNWASEKCSETTGNCPDGYDEPIVILFSIDGFRAEYLYRELTPNIWKMASCGVHVPYLRSVFPTKTFPNHYTIATGLYPESHGIVDNTMFDHEHNEEFNLGSPESFHSFWWGGEPIWLTSKNQGKKSACYFWPGSDVNIAGYPDYYFKYDGSVTNEERMYQAFDWLDLPKEDRPAFITLYMDIVDHAGHDGGPVSDEVDRQLVEADRVVGILMEGLKLRGLENCVNLIMLADHGMAPISCDRKASLQEYGVRLDEVYYRTGAFGRVGKSDDKSKWSLFNATEVHEMLRCHHDESHWLSYLKYEYEPKRYHYANNDRIEDILLAVDDEWLVEGRTGSNTNCNGGTHGYDNEFKSMHALFAAHGPAFKRAYNSSEPIENIEVYNLMTDILDVAPAPNNGTPGALYHVMSSPKSIPSKPSICEPSECSYETDTATGDLGCQPCGGLSEDKANQRLDLSSDDRQKYTSKHLLYGAPEVGKPSGESTCTQHCLLVHEDFVSMFDYEKQIPFYSSYTLTQMTENLTTLEPLDCARPDVRLPIDQMTSCKQYSDDVAVMQNLLYPQELSTEDSKHDAVILSNIVPMYPIASQVWKYMTSVLAKWSDMYGEINVVSGPAYDYNYDGLADDVQILNSWGKFLNNDSSSTPIPTHFFLVATRCMDRCGDWSLSTCATSPANVEVLSFIIPNYQTEPCHEENENEGQWIPRTLKEHVARVRDVELITSLLFGAEWDEDEHVKSEKVRFLTRLPQFTSDWMKDFVGESYDEKICSGANLSFLPSSLRVTFVVILLLIASTIF